MNVKDDSEAIKARIDSLEQELDVTKKQRTKMEKVLRQATDSLVIALSVFQQLF